MFQTKHNLSFEIAEWKIFGWKAKLIQLIFLGKNYNLQGWLLYRVGTVHGQWRSTEDALEILSFINNQPGNGHLEDVFEWFEMSCKRDNKNLIIRSFWNENFKNHCIKKREFLPLGSNDLIKLLKEK